MFKFKNLSCFCKSLLDISFQVYEMLRHKCAFFSHSKENKWLACNFPLVAKFCRTSVVWFWVGFFGFLFCLV